MNAATFPKHYITPCFDHLDLTNVMVLLVMLMLASMAAHD